MPYEPLTLGLKFEVRLEDLTARDVVVVTCPACHWTSNVAPHVLLSRYHELRKLVDVRKDMVCKRCGAKGDLHWRIERAVGPQWPKGA